MGPIKIFLAAAFSGILIVNGGMSISSNELIENAIKYDKQIVIYSGEVIGDIMKRGDGAWINVSDGNNAIGIWLPYSETKIIKYTGQYSYIGDTVKIEGIFNKACPEHGGDLDIHFKKIEVLKEGYIIQKKVNYRNILIAGILLIFAVILNLIIFRKKL